MSVSPFEAVGSRAHSGARALTIGAYAILGGVLAWSRLAHLGKSFWFDETFFIVHYVRKGPRGIISGPGLSHELYGLALWATGSLVGESEIAYRLWSVLPFLAGVALVTAWLHTRIDIASALAFLFLATVSPLLLDITRQARGYGLAFFFMAVVIVAALEASRTERTAPVVVMCVAGVLGAWTLPQVGIGFLATGAALFVHRALWRPTLVGLVGSAAAIWVWYAPHRQQVQGAAQIPDGRHIHTAWLVTAPLDQILLPALVYIEGVVLIPGLVWLPFALLAVVVIAASPLVRQRGSALVLGAGPVVMVVFLWAGSAWVIPRYLSFLLVPMFVLVATGAGAILSRARHGKAIVRATLVVVAGALLVANFIHVAPDLVRLPKEDPKSAADVIRTQAPSTTPVYTRLSLPLGLVFYLGRLVHPLQRSTAAARVCGNRVEVAYVMQPFSLKPVTIPCLSRPGVRHFRFAQYTRGGEIDVWLVPQAP